MSEYCPFTFLDTCVSEAVIALTNLLTFAWEEMRVPLQPKLYCDRSWIDSGHFHRTRCMVLRLGTPVARTRTISVLVDLTLLTSNNRNNLPAPWFPELHALHAGRRRTRSKHQAPSTKLLPGGRGGEGKGSWVDRKVLSLHGVHTYSMAVAAAAAAALLSLQYICSL